MTTDLTPAERAPSDEVADRYGWQLFAAPRRTLPQLLADDSWLRNRPEVTAIAAFEATALFAGLSLNGADHHDYMTAVVAYLAGLAAAIFGAVEVCRPVSARQEVSQ